MPSTLTPCWEAMIGVRVERVIQLTPSAGDQLSKHVNIGWTLHTQSVAYHLWPPIGAQHSHLIRAQPVVHWRHETSATGPSNREINKE